MAGLRIGIHTSIAGWVARAAERAAELGANTFQIFSSSPRSWATRPLTRPEVEELKRLRAELDLHPMAVHDNYLINLAAARESLRQKSVAAFREELIRSLELGADYLVLHPGSYRGLTRREGIEKVVQSLDEACQELGSDRLTLLLENTAGAGASLGSCMEELAELAERVRSHIGFPVGFCLDTAHLLAAGYDVASADGLEKTLEEARRVLGMQRVPLMHANDSRAPLGSRVDRHEHIGKGHIGQEGFRRILAHAELRAKAFILETPLEREGDDLRNMRTLWRLAGEQPGTKPAPRRQSG